MTIDYKPDVEVVRLIVARALPVLGGHHPANQGAALADLLATWLAGHPPAFRDELLAFHLKAVRQLTLINAEALGTGQ